MIDYFGTEGSDVFLDGTDADEAFYGLGGNDLIFGSRGNDFMDGGTGRDTLRFDMDRFAAPTGPTSFTLGNGLFTNEAGTINTQFANIETFEFFSRNANLVTLDASAFVPTDPDARFYQLIVRLFDSNSNLTGSAYNDYFQLTGENHTVDGGEGFDAVRLAQQEEGGTVYITSNGGVTTVTQWMNAGYEAELARLTNVETVGILQTVTFGSFITVDGSGSDIGIRFFDGAGDDNFIGSNQTDVFFKSGGTVGFDGFDYFTGGGGADFFVFGPEAAWLDNTYITDFAAEDLIDLTAFAVEGAVFIGTTQFSGTGAEIRYESMGSETVIQVDQDGDGSVDGTMYITNGAFELVLSNNQDRLELVIGGTFDPGTDDYFSIYDVNMGPEPVVIDGGAGYDTLDATAIDVSPARLFFDASTVDGEDTDTISVAGYELVGFDFILGSVNGPNSFYLPNYDRAVELVGSDFGDSFFGSFENGDVYYGGGGDDVMFVGAGDVAWGDDGDDTFDIYPRYGEDQDALIQGGNGTDLIRTTFGMTVDLANGAVYSNTPGLGHWTFVAGVENVQVATRQGFETFVYGNDDANVFSVSTNSDDPRGSVYFYGGAGDDQLIGSLGSDRLFGGDGDDVIEGRSGNDRIEGGFGNDRLDGGIGFDSIYGGDGDDVIFGGFGNDTIFGDDGADTIDGGARDDVIDGGAGGDTLSGGEGNDRLFGGWGNDAIDGGAGDDYIEGGDDVDTITGGTGHDTIIGGFGSDVLGGGDQDDLIRGGAGYDTIRGDVGNDTLEGGSGNDTIDGGIGFDTILGGTGNDTVFGGFGNDTISGDAGNDMLYGDGGTDTIDGGDGVDTIYGGTGNDIISGGFGSDRLYGGAGEDVIRGGAGYDTIFGDAGNDTLFGDAGNDTMNGGDGVDTIYGGTGRDTITGGFGSDRLYGGGDADLIRGGAGYDTILGDEGDDRLYGEDGNDTVTGGFGDDIVDGGAGNDRLDGGAGYDLVFGRDGDDTLDGGDGVDTVYGGTGNDVMLGGFGSDLLYGGAGDDRVEGGAGYDLVAGNAGNDVLWGGAGNDVFRFDLAGTAHADTIADFTNGADRIELDLAGAFSALAGTGTLAASAFVAGPQALDADDRILYDQSTGQLFYDADGSGAGAAQLFATVAAGTVLSASDFRVVDSSAAAVSAAADKSDLSMMAENALFI